MKVIGNYIEFVQPVLQPSCGFILLNINGTQFGKLTDLLCKLVHDAIGKYIHQTRYCRIVETESSAILDLDEQHWSPRIRNTAPRLQRLITRRSALETLQLTLSYLGGIANSNNHEKKHYQQQQQYCSRPNSFSENGLAG